MRANRSLLVDAISDIIVLELGRDEIVRGRAVLDPVHDSQDEVVLGVIKAGHTEHCSGERSGLAVSVHVVGSVLVGGRTGAVLHTGDQEEAVEVVDGNVLGAEGFLDVVVQVDRGAGRDGRVGVAVVVEELPALLVEGGDVEVVSGGVSGVDLVGESHEVRVPVLPGPVAANLEHVLDVGDEVVVQAGGADFSAEGVSREDQGVVGFVPGVEELVHGLELGWGHAGVVGGGGVAHHGDGVEDTSEGVLQDVVFQAVLRVALLQDLVLDSGHLSIADVVVCGFGEVPDGSEDVPQLLVRSPPGRCAGNHTVEVVREHFDFFEALLTTGGATPVVAVRDVLSVVALGNLLSVDHGIVEGAVAPVGKGSFVVVSEASVVALVAGVG